MVYDPIRGEPTWCPCRPHRTKIYRINQYIKRSGIPAPFRYRFVPDFKERYDNGQPIPGAKQLTLRLHTLIDDIHNGKESLKGFYLWGTPGGGKTFFSYVMLNELIFKFAKPGKFISLSKSFQELRHTFDEGSETQGQAMSMIEVLSNVPYLVIDDFGVQRNTEWEMEILYNLIDARYANRRLTFVTTNQKIDELKQLAQARIYSRILEMCYIIQVTAPDYREMGNPEERWVDLS
jgi:DNA replication protein DnaC